MPIKCSYDTRSLFLSFNFFVVDDSLAEKACKQIPSSDVWGASHYARPTGQRSAGLTKENGATFSDQLGNKRNGFYHFLFRR